MNYSLKRLVGLSLLNLSIATAAATIWQTAAAQNETAPAGTLRGPKQVVSDTKPMSFKVNYIYRPSGKGDLKPLENGGVLKSGDHYKIRFTPEESGYVYIFQVDSSGTVYQLFPMQEWQGVVLDNNNPVRAGTTYMLPADNKSFVLDNQNGSETIYFMASRKQDPDISKLAEQLSSARQRGNTRLDSSTQQALKSTLKTRGPAKIVTDPTTETEVSWNKEEKFKVSQQRLDGLCSSCVNQVTFSHR
jgi:hypothetical protein